MTPQDENFEPALRQAFRPAPAPRRLREALDDIPSRIPQRRVRSWPARGFFGWRLGFGFGLAGAMCAFLLGLWLGDLAVPQGDDVALFSDLQNDYLEALL